MHTPRHPIVPAFTVSNDDCPVSSRLENLHRERDAGVCARERGALSRQRLESKWDGGPNLISFPRSLAHTPASLSRARARALSPPRSLAHSHTRHF